MKNLENLYIVIKNFLPYADNYLKGTPLEPYVPQLQGVIDIVESLGGITIFSSLFNELQKTSTQTPPNNRSAIAQIQNKCIDEKNLKSNRLNSIDSYKRS